MLDSTHSERIKDLADVAFKERDNHVPTEIMKIDNEFISAGSYGSSGWTLHIQAIFGRETAIRVEQVWKSIVRVHETLGCQMPDSLRADLKDAIRTYASAIHRDLNVSMLKATRGSLEQSGKALLDDARDLAVAKHVAEVDVYVDSLETKHKSKEASFPASTYHFYGTVGAVQSGPGSVANVAQTINAENRTSLLSALEQVKAALSDASLMPANQRDDLLGITTDCQHELESENPNNTKLMAFLTVIGTGIQSIADARPAYEALKGAALCLGINIP